MSWTWGRLALGCLNGSEKAERARRKIAAYSAKICLPPNFDACYKGNRLGILQHSGAIP